MVISKKQLSVDHLLIIRTMAKGKENYTKLGHNFYKDKFSVKGYRNTKKLTGKTDFIKMLKLELIKNIGGRLTLNQKQYDYETIKELQAIKLGGQAFKATVRKSKYFITIVDEMGLTIDIVDLDEFERRYVIIHN